MMTTILIVLLVLETLVVVWVLFLGGAEYLEGTVLGYFLVGHAAWVSPAFIKVVTVLGYAGSLVWMYTRGFR